MSFLEIKNLHAKISGKRILNGINLKIGRGELHILMGPNGSGKSTLAQVLAGNSAYEILKGSVKFQNKDLLKMKSEKRARAGIFLQFQNPPNLFGISLGTLTRRARKALNPTSKKDNILEASKEISEKAKLYRFDNKFLEREMNGFSGGEKKKAEIFQSTIMPWKLAIFDEPDSGLDADGVNLAAIEINRLINKERSALLITHTQRIARHLKPARVHIMVNGKIALSGGIELIEKIEKSGYERLLKKSKDEN